VNPADLTQSLARGARRGGAAVVEGVRVTGYDVSDGPTGRRVTGVQTDAASGGQSVECEVVAAGCTDTTRGAASVRVVRGGRASEPYALDNGLYAVDIMLDQTLEVGETGSMEYETTFWYRTPPPQEFRRASSGRIDNLDLRVQFHPLRLPAQVWWSEWPALDDPPATSEPVGLDVAKSVHRHLDAIERTVVGFRWEIAQRRYVRRS
jgi:phytoene dehydrogenase-like protein